MEGSHQEVWGTVDYTSNYDPTVFFGVYGLRDFIALWQHKGRKAILWCGSDIQHFLLGYWLDPEGKMRIHPTTLSSWIDTYCESYVENETEQVALRSVGIRSKVVPSFMGDVKNFEVSFKPGNKLYTSVSGNDFELYGWNLLPTLAGKNPDIQFHCYGNTIPFDGGASHPLNLIIHGRVPKEQMNAEIKEMQGALRLTQFDGFSEIIAKSILMGQWPVSLIEYPHMLKLNEIKKILHKKDPNTFGRNYYLDRINKFPWNNKQQNI